MSLSSSRATRLRVLAALTGIGMAAATIAVGSSAIAEPTGTADPTFADGYYFVEMKAEPIATYVGNTPGFERTKPETGQRLDMNDPAVKAYEAKLLQEQKAVVSTVGVKPQEQLTAASNGVVAKLTADQAAKLARNGKVAGLHKSEQLHLQTVDSSRTLGLTGGDGLWREFGTPRQAGEGVVVGIIDTGITPGHPSFAGKRMPNKDTGKVNQPSMDADGNVTMKRADGGTFQGKCETGPGFTLNDCNDKIIAARAFPSQQWLELPADQKPADEVPSPRDYHSHGSHVASTAAGNFGVPASIGMRTFGRASGVAPGAKIATYKVCFTDNDDNSGDCNNFSSMRAIDAAVKDGVDVLNFSISGNAEYINDPVAMAFKRAAEAGIYVAAAAGNAGPGPSTLNHMSPWLTTVAAASHVLHEGTVLLGKGAPGLGSSINNRVVSTGTPLVYAKNVAAEGKSADDAKLCLKDTLDPAKAKGKIVLCDRGGNARIDKSAEAKRAGAVGAIVANVGPSSLNADLHSIPTVHVDHVTGARLREYASTEGATAGIIPGNGTKEVSTPAPEVSGFSSRGPGKFADGDLLKPDVAAPGVDVLAAVTKYTYDGERFGLMSGTSMASPHVAGLAALVLAKNPDWTPDMVKSALMTTAFSTNEGPTGKSRDGFAQGAGHINPRAVLRPGLVYKNGPDQWNGLLKHSGAPGMGDVAAVAPADVNLASIALGSLPGKRSVKRTVTALTPGTYSASVDLPGIDVQVSPSTLTFDKAGESKTFEVAFTTRDAALNEYAKGFLTWKSGATTVRSPLAVRPVAIAMPTNVSANLADGKAQFDVTSGTTDAVELGTVGLVAGERHTGTVELFKPDNAASKKFHTLEVPEGTILSRVDLVAGAGSNDLDLFICGDEACTTYFPSKGAGATDQASERIDAVLKPGKYQVQVMGYDVDATKGGQYTLNLFNLKDGDAGNATITPNVIKANRGDKTTVTVALKDGTPRDKPLFGIITASKTGTKTLIQFN